MFPYCPSNKSLQNDSLSRSTHWQCLLAAVHLCTTSVQSDWAVLAAYHNSSTLLGRACMHTQCEIRHMVIADWCVMRGCNRHSLCNQQLQPAIPLHQMQAIQVCHIISEPHTLVSAWVSNPLVVDRVQSSISAQ